MKQIYTIIFLFSFFFSGNAQMGQQYSLYMLNPFYTNPAYAGLDNSLSVTGVYRKQWVGLEGSPSSQNINAHMPFYYLRGGIGINIDNDIIGAERSSSATVSYNYQIPVTKKGILSIGLAGGLIQRSIDGAKLRARDGNYEGGLIEHNDQLLSNIEENAFAPTFNAGIYYQSETFEAGLSSTHLTDPKVTYTNSSFVYNRHYYMFLKYNFDLNNTLSVHPSIMIKSNVNQLQTDFSVIVKYNDNIFGGTAFRGYNKNAIDALVLMAGYKLNEKITLAYAYDITLSTYNTTSQGSHEIVVNYNLNKVLGGGIPEKIIHNPRFL